MQNPNWTNGGNEEIHPGSSNMEYLQRKILKNDADIKTISSRMHQAISAASEIDRVVEEKRQTPFPERVECTQVKGIGKLRFLVYEGKTDP